MRRGRGVSNRDRASGTERQCGDGEEVLEVAAGTAAWPVSVPEAAELRPRRCKW